MRGSDDLERVLEDLLYLASGEASREVRVDAAYVRAALGLEVEFPLDDAVRHRFLEGLDDIGLTLQKGDAIDTYESGRPTWLPRTA